MVNALYLFMMLTITAAIVLCGWGFGLKGDIKSIDTKTAKWIAIAAFISYIAIYLIVYLYSFISSKITGIGIDFYLKNSDINIIKTKVLIIDGIVSIILAPIIEEIIFRGLCIKLLSKFVNKTPYINAYLIFASSVIFGLVHHKSSITISYAIIIGGILGFLYLYDPVTKKEDKNILRSIMFHMIYNFIAFVTGLISGAF